MALQHVALRRRQPLQPLQVSSFRPCGTGQRTVSRPGDQDDRAVGRRRRYRQHLPAPCAATAEAAGPAGRHRQRHRRLRHGRRPRGQGLARRRLHHLRHARLHPPRALLRAHRHQLQRFRPSLPCVGHALGTDSQPEDAVEDLARVPGGCQEAPRRDHGRRHAELDQPHLSRRRSKKPPASSSSTCPTRGWHRA